VDARVDGALGYRELIDVRRATPTVTAADVERVVDLVSPVARGAAHGPTAVVASSDFAYGMRRMLEMLVEGAAAIRPFRGYREAVRWLARTRGTQRDADSTETRA
jgi:hypothetical protein